MVRSSPADSTTTLPVAAPAARRTVQVTPAAVSSARRAVPGSSSPTTPASATEACIQASQAAVLAADPPPVIRTRAAVSEPDANAVLCRARMSVAMSPTTTMLTADPRSQQARDLRGERRVAQDDAHVHVDAAPLGRLVEMCQQAGGDRVAGDAVAFNAGESL